MQRMLGIYPITIRNNTFSNHKGTPVLYALKVDGFLPFASSPIISFSFWRELTKDSVDNLLYPWNNDTYRIRIENCVFSGNNFNITNGLDTKLVYFDSITGPWKIHQEYQNPFSFFLKYFYDGEEFQYNNLHPAYNPVKDGFNKIEVTILGSAFVQNGLYNGQGFGLSLCTLNFTLNTFTSNLLSSSAELLSIK